MSVGTKCHGDPTRSICHISACNNVVAKEIKIGVLIKQLIENSRCFWHPVGFLRHIPPNRNVTGLNPAGVPFCSFYPHYSDWPLYCVLK